MIRLHCCQKAFSSPCTARDYLLLPLVMNNLYSDEYRYSDTVDWVIWLKTSPPTEVVH